MKKLALLIAVIFVAHGFACAQRKIEYGFQLGAGLAIQHIDNSGLLSNNSIRTFNASVIVNFPVLKHYYVSISPGIANKGTVITEDALTTTNRITYYELPVYLIRKYKISGFGKIVGGIGGYVAMGGKGSLDYETPGSNNSDYVSFGNERDFQKYDAGISVMTGLQLNNRLIFNLDYDFGLNNIASQTLKDTGTANIYNREFTISLGLLF